MAKKMIRKNFYITPELNEKLVEECKINCETESTVLRTALIQYFKKKEKENGKKRQ